MRVYVGFKYRDATAEEIAERKATERSRPLTAEEVTALLIRQQINTLLVDEGVLPGVGGRTGLPGVQRPLRFGGAVCGERSINGHI